MSTRARLNDCRGTITSCAQPVSEQEKGRSAYPSRQAYTGSSDALSASASLFSYLPLAQLSNYPTNEARQVPRYLVVIGSPEYSIELCSLQYSLLSFSLYVQTLVSNFRPAMYDENNRVCWSVGTRKDTRRIHEALFIRIRYPGTGVRNLKDLKFPFSGNSCPIIPVIAYCLYIAKSQFAHIFSTPFERGQHESLLHEKRAMSSTNDAVAAEPPQGEVEVYGVTLMRYLAMTGITLVIYDYLLTLDDEVGLICLYLLFHTPHSLFAGAPHVAGDALLAKGPVLHQSLCIHPWNDISQLPLVA